MKFLAWRCSDQVASRLDGSGGGGGGRTEGKFRERYAPIRSSPVTWNPEYPGYAAAAFR